jgi:hypothetical protein
MAWREIAYAPRDGSLLVLVVGPVYARRFLVGRFDLLHSCWMADPISASELPVHIMPDFFVELPPFGAKQQDAA